MKAVWNGQILAESDQTVVVENNHYFPMSSLKKEFFRDSAQQTTCPWKGTASYFDIVVDGELNAGAAWFYAEPFEAASKIRDRVAFWRGVTVSE